MLNKEWHFAYLKLYSCTSATDPGITTLSRVELFFAVACMIMCVFMHLLFCCCYGKLPISELEHDLTVHA